MKAPLLAVVVTVIAFLAAGEARAQDPYGDARRNDGPARDVYYPLANGYVYEPASVYLVPVYHPYTWPDYGLSYGWYTAPRAYRPYERGFVAPSAYDLLWHYGYVPGYIDPYDPYVVYPRRGLFEPPVQAPSVEPAGGVGRAVAPAEPYDDRPAPMFDVPAESESPASGS